MTRRRYALALVLAVITCCGGAPERPPRCAIANWRRVESRDSLVSLCVPPGFARTSSGHRWARGTAGQSDYLWLTVSVLDSADAISEWGSPPKPSSMRVPGDSSVPDFVRAESVVVHYDTVDGRLVAVETGLLTGGVVGFYRAPAIRTAWQLPRGRWGLAQGFAERPGQLDTIRAMTQTIHVR